MIEYSLLSNNKGVATKRAPQLIDGDLVLRFQNPPDFGYVAAAKGDKVIYSDIINGECKIRLSNLEGKLSVAVASRNFTRKWACEGLNIITDEGRRFVTVDDGDLPEIVAYLAQTVDNLAQDNESGKVLSKSLLNSVSELERKVDGQGVEIDSLIKAYNNPMG